MAETVIGRALVLVLEDLVGLVDFLELDLAGVIPRIAVGVKLHRKLAEDDFSTESSAERSTSRVS
jgi:hypothetical protein